MEQEIIYKDYKIRVVYDETPDSPDDWQDEKLFLVYEHRQFTVRRDGFKPGDIYDYIMSLSHPDDEFDVMDYSDYYIYPVEAYIHSGVELSLYELELTCPFDSSVSGYILIKKSYVLKFPNIVSDRDKADKAYELANELIETWNQYLSGEVYGYVIEKPNIMYSIEKSLFDELVLRNDLADLESHFMEDIEYEEIDSCWGFYGDPEDSGLIDDAKSTVDYECGKI